jgi:hypothetical protein
MKDLTRKWHQLRADARYFAIMSTSATDPSRRELFKRLGEELAIEALELEQVVKKQTARCGSDEQYEVVVSKAIVGK